MANVTTHSVVRQIESLYGGGSIAGLTDRQLVERFVTWRDSTGEDAFAALVARHGPMVLRVCRALLGDRQHAEDAFQAVFLVLARKAGSVRDPDLLGNWLYGIALRTARKARARLARQRTEESRAVIHSEASTTMAAEQVAMSREQVETLHAEIERLPGLFRAPVVLCYFEGLTLDQAAVHLRCPAGTIHSRLVRARNKLRRGLIRRGVTLSATALVASLSSQSATASVSSQMCESTAREAIHFAVGRSVATIPGALALDVLRSVAIYKLKSTSLTLLLIAAISTSACYFAFAHGGNDGPKSAAVSRQAPVAGKPDDANAKPAPGRMFVVGRVLDPQGNPVPGATVAASVRSKFPDASAVGLERPTLSEIGHADVDSSGRFRVDVPRTSWSRNDMLVGIAAAPGFGLGWVNMDPDAVQPAADITLEPEQVIEGRLFDVQGRPAQGVTVSVSSIERGLVHDAERLIDGREFGGLHFEWSRVNDMAGWPKPAIADADGRFNVYGIGRRLKTSLSMIDSRFALESVSVETDGAAVAKVVTRTLQPAKVFSGRVTDAQTGEPVPNARLRVSARGAGQVGIRLAQFRADAEGRFRVQPPLGDRFTIAALPNDGRTYVETLKGIDWPKGAVEQSVDLALARGATIRGKVVEEGTAHPIAGAFVSFVTLSRVNVNPPGWRSNTVTSADGSFELAGLARTGHLSVQAPSDDYVLREIGVRELLGRPGGRRLYSNYVIACDPKPNGPALDFPIALRRGVTLKGRIVGPDDQAVQNTWIIGRPAIDPRLYLSMREWSGSYHQLAASGDVELHGLDPDTEVSVYFLQAERRLGKVTRVRGKSASSGPLTIRLDPCGTATARLVDAQGRAIAGDRNTSLVDLIVTPGPDRLSRDPEGAKRLDGEAASLESIDPINYSKPPASDAEGRISFPALIPGATYRISDQSTRNSNGLRAAQVRKEFTIKPGEALDLGDILIEKPAS